MIISPIAVLYDEMMGGSLKLHYIRFTASDHKCFCFRLLGFVVCTV